MKQSSHTSSGQKEIHAQQLKLPKGGGAMKGIGETFAPDSFSGTGSYSIPFPLTSARGFDPHVTLSYNSGSGNSPFGLGFSSSFSKISRRTEQGIPRYDDKDIFMDGGEELVPQSTRPEIMDTGGWAVSDYVPRIEGDFSKIEYWQNSETKESYWQVIGRDNSNHIYGKSSSAQIVDPDDSTRIFEWLIEQSTDAKGNIINYTYKSENNDNVPNVSWEQERSLSNKYLQSIQYGNFLDPSTKKTTFAFEVIFDYGEYDLSHLEKGGTDPYTPTQKWAYRPDAFSSYRSGFEIRTRRRCQNILLFHKLEQELGAPSLVKSLSLGYVDQQSSYKTTNPADLSLLQILQFTGFRREGLIATDMYDVQSMPSLDLGFSGFQPPENPEFKTLTIVGNNQVQSDVLGVQFQPVDMEGEGIAGLLSSNDNTLWYMSPQGEGSYAPPRSPENFPINRNFSDGHVSFMDLEGNGQLDLVVHNDGHSGFYPHQEDGSWGNYTSFVAYPSTHGQSYMEAVDLSANGKTDALVAEQNSLLVYESQGQAGYAAAVMVSKPEDFPIQKSASKTELVTFADLFGDGLSHRVKIKNGSIECWPDLGYGNFGNKITLGDAPVFGEQFDISRLHLADIDGSGTTDLVYVSPKKVMLFLNKSGNSFSDPITVDLPATLTKLDKISFSDVLGNGTTCLMFTKNGPNPQHYYYSFVGETLINGKEQQSLKPYLLNEINNNIGAITQIQYTSSTKFYLADKQAGNSWITKLYFPVQVVETVTTIDQISGANFVQKFAYHDGFYDTVEREFRGFGYVESWDTQTYEEGQTIEKDLYVPPVYTRSWYHTGVFSNESAVSTYYQNLYYKGDKDAYNLPDSIIPEASPSVNPETIRQAHVALKGHVIRQEVYGQDGTPEADNPYAVHESNFEVRLIQPIGDINPYAVFIVLPRESIVYHYERNPNDPRVQQSFTLDVDEYGNIKQSCAVVLHRRKQTTGKVYPEQQESKATISTDTFINETSSFRLIGINDQSQEFELFGIPPVPKNGYFSFEPIQTAVETALKSVIPYKGALKLGNIQARQLSWSTRYFWNEGQTDFLPKGNITSPGLLHHQENAVFTENFIQNTFAGRLADDTVTNLGGYFFDTTSGYYWNKGLVQNYSDASGFFLPSSTENSFVDPTSTLYVKTGVTYDDYFFRPVTVSAYVDQNTNNTTQTAIDYITVAPKQMIGINGNVSQVLFDPLGQVTVSSLFGMQNGIVTGGMSLYPYGGQTKAEYIPRTKTAKGKPIDAQDVLTNPSYYLQGAAHYFYYNLESWKTSKQPASAVNLIRNNDYHSPDQNSKPYCQILVSYGDGLGRALEVKLKTDPNPKTPTTERWQVSGSTVYNNKSQPAEQYFPYFSDTPDYEDQKNIRSSLASIIKYDPLGRVIKTINPKKLFSKVEFTPWEESHYDEDDTVIDSKYYTTFMKNYPPHPTQQQQDEKDALEKAAKFYNTPTIKIFDTLGHTFLEIETEVGGKQLISSHQVDILGRVIQSIDPRLYQSNISKGTSYYNFKYTYAMEEEHPVSTNSIDGGVEKHLSDIYGAQLWSWSPRNFCQLITYDHLRRRSQVQVQKITTTGPVTSYDDFNLVEIFTYGEGQKNAQDNNLRGQLYELKDLSGIVLSTSYDLRGQLLSASRQIVQEYQTQISWNNLLPTLEPTIYPVSFTYDALGHLLTETTPDTSITTNTYNQAGFLNAVQVEFADKTTQSVIESIDYDAKDQRTQVVYSNKVITKYSYESTTLRLTDILSTRPNGSKTETVQNTNYTYDPVGNVTRTRDNAVQTIFNNNQKIDPLSDYTYDALYRLTQSCGRQHPRIAANTYENNPSNNDFLQSKFSQLPSTNQADALENYTETYTYDDSNNLIQKKHAGKSLCWTKKTPVEENSNHLQDHQYDPSGNMRTLDINGTVNLTFNCCENLISVGIITRPTEPDDCDYYLYDSNKQRTRKVSQSLAGGGAVTQIEEKVYLGNYEIKRKKAITGDTQKITMEHQTLRVMDGGNCVAIIHAMVTQNSKPDDARTFRFQIANQQDSVALEMDQDANLISYEEYFPYGGTAIIAGKNKVEVKLKEYRYSGKERDDSTGLYYYGARYYAPWLGRWLKPDPAGTMDGMNVYAFVGGNPVTHVDVGGLTKKKKSPVTHQTNAQPSKKKSKKSSAPTLNSHDDLTDRSFALGKLIGLGFQKTSPSQMENAIVAAREINASIDTALTSAGWGYTQKDKSIKNAISKAPTKTNKQFGATYRNVTKAMDESLSTSTMRELIKGFYSTNTDQNAEDLFFEQVKTASYFRLETRETGYNLGGGNAVQHTTQVGAGFFGTSGLNHGEWDRDRRQSVVEAGEVTPNPLDIMTTMTAESSEITLNDKSAPATASNITSQQGQADNQQQARHRDILKIIGNIIAPQGIVLSAFNTLIGNTQPENAPWEPGPTYSLFGFIERPYSPFRTT